MAFKFYYDNFLVYIHIHILLQVIFYFFLNTFKYCLLIFTNIQNKPILNMGINFFRYKICIKILMFLNILVN